ncbi:hypothetical protein [Corynebacterium accolens]|uniref:hypothetical protein n=1 Tax=Corynebacterium accolens TaxID=38284 RepID=UPI001EDC2460|nr:hypothetical protein [Corynebacterium accolens]
MVKIRTAISTSAATLVALSAVTGVGAASAQAEEASEAQPGTDTNAEEAPAEEAQQAQPGTDASENAGNDEESNEESAPAADEAQPGTDVNAKLPNQANIPSQPANNAQPGTETPADTSQQAQPGTETETPAPKPVESDNGDNTNNPTTPQWSDEIVSEQPADQPVTPSEPVDNTQQPTYGPAAHTTDSQDLDVEAEPAYNPEPVSDDVDNAPQHEAPAEEVVPNTNPQPEEVETAQPVEPVQPAVEEPTPAGEEVVQQPAAPVETNEVEGAKATVTAPGITVTAQGQAQPFDGDVTISTAAGESTIALPANEVAWAQQAGQNAAKALPEYGQENLNALHNAVIDEVENLPTEQQADLGAVSVDVTIDHKTV